MDRIDDVREQGDDVAIGEGRAVSYRTVPDLEKTATPGIYRRHRKDCERNGRCDCAWVITWRHRGQQYKETCRSFNEARQRKAAHESGELEPRSKTKFGDYFPE